jgi:hypothetical protein
MLLRWSFIIFTSRCGRRGTRMPSPGCIDRAAAMPGNRSRRLGGVAVGPQFTGLLDDVSSPVL